MQSKLQKCKEPGSKETLLGGACPESIATKCRYLSELLTATHSIHIFSYQTANTNLQI